MPRLGRSPDQEPSDPLARLNRLNPTIVVIATVALFLGVLLLPDLLAAAVLLLLATALGVLLSRTWPVLPRQQRVLRLAVIGLLVLVAATRALL